MSDEELDALLEDEGEPSDDVEVVIPEDRPMFRIPSGKYKGLVLPRLINLKPTYYEKVLALKQEIEQDPEFVRHADTIARTYAEVRREAEKKAAELSEIKLRLETIKLLMIEQYEVEGTTGLTLSGGDKIRWEPAPHLVMLNKEEFRLWCIEQGLERDMVLPWQKANSIAKEMKLAGRPEPPGAEVYMLPKVVFTKGKK